MQSSLKRLLSFTGELPRDHLRRRHAGRHLTTCFPMRETNPWFAISANSTGVNTPTAVYQRIQRKERFSQTGGAGSVCPHGSLFPNALAPLEKLPKGRKQDSLGGGEGRLMALSCCPLNTFAGLWKHELWESPRPFYYKQLPYCNT